MQSACVVARMPHTPEQLLRNTLWNRAPWGLQEVGVAWAGLGALGGFAGPGLIC
jgi:hypothetical protein